MGRLLLTRLVRKGHLAFALGEEERLVPVHSFIVRADFGAEGAVDARVFVCGMSGEIGTVAVRPLKTSAASSMALLFVGFGHDWEWGAGCWGRWQTYLSGALDMTRRQASVATLRVMNGRWGRVSSVHRGRRAVKSSREFRLARMPV